MGHRQLNLPPVPVQSSSPRRESVAPPEGNILSLTGLLADSVDEAGYPEGNAARDMGYEPNYWSRIKSGEKAAHLERIGRLPERVQRAFVTRWAGILRLRITDSDTQKHAAVTLLKAAADFLAESA